MDYGDYYWGLYRGYYRDPFPHSLLSTREIGKIPSPLYQTGGLHVSLPLQYVPEIPKLGVLKQGTQLCRAMGSVLKGPAV